MTLLVGILCEDGAVIAADRQLTQGMVGVSSSKIRRVNNNTIFAASGPVGTGQQVEYALLQFHSKFGGMDYADAVIQMQPIIQDKVLMPNYAISHRLNRPIQSCECFFSSVFKDGLCLAHMNWEGNFTKLTREHSFRCAGSGGLNGTALLSVIRSALFAEALPTLEKGIMAAAATVKTAIDLRSPGVGFDVDVKVLRRAGENMAVAETISSQQMSEHLDLIEWAKKQVIAAWDTLTKAPPGKQIDRPPERHSS